MTYNFRSIKLIFLQYHVSILVLVIVAGCTVNRNIRGSETVKANLTDTSKRSALNGLNSLTVYEGLQVETFAAEPMLKNPTNIDVDERGRVWLTEAYNYRPDITGNPTNPKGDRIIILEDTNGDGKADSSKVFYQGPELNAPLGIAVLGKRVLISQSPYVWAFYDDNGDDKADRKEIVFQGIDGEQHDHGMHAFIFGPDGKLYFNFGNAGKTLKDKNNQVVLDQDGDPIGPGKYTQGMVFRSDPDGTNVECLGQNFRNNYEVAVDSYGTMWQSDNDDDGNKGVRINYVMDYGNYGYTDEITGAGWQANRTNIEDSIPLRHWHLNDPGVVPNLLQTGAGSPTGMVIYEGGLLPKQFHNQMIHTDAGPNVVRSYPVQNSGAGYTAEIINILKGEKDQWFRPADVGVAPDGSLIVADWYDPGVGGHQVGDLQRGRIYRVAPPGTKYKIPTYDYTKPAEAVKALQNPNLAVRHHAWNALQSLGSKAIPHLEKVWKSSSNPRMQARAFWALVKMPGGNAVSYLQQAAKNPNPDLRITALRAARQLKLNVIELVSQLVNDSNAQVRRECALALRHNASVQAPELWAALALQYDGKDRWYLEALGIAADKQWNPFFAAYAKKVNNTFETPAQKDIVWRARSEQAVPYLAKLASNKSQDLKSRLRYFRAFDFNPGLTKSTFLLEMLEKGTQSDLEFNKLVLRHMDADVVKKSEDAQTVLANVLMSLRGSADYIELVSRYDLKTESANLLELAINKPDENVGKDAAELLLKLEGSSLINSIIKGKDIERQENLLRSLARIGNKESIDILKNTTFSSSYTLSLRKLSAEMIGRSYSGEDVVIALLKEDKVPAELIQPMVKGVSWAWRKTIRDEAATYLPNAISAVQKQSAAIQELLAFKPDATNGKAIFNRSCNVCHMVNKQGFDFGPKLSEIGSKLPKESLLEAIVHPSGGISFGFEGWQLDMKDGSTLSGIMTSKTETDIDLQYPGGAKQRIKTADVKTISELKESMMPEGLDQTMSNQEQADLLEYLARLTKK
ncbi:MAG: HEAT repeat domain-containing protein [Flavobacterium sp.]|nr:HEAT repeat domain-containing protein [Pedobacter sp.]